MIRGAALGASLLATLAEPATWALALLAFLLRGGFVLVLAPIVTIPSAVGLGNLFGPILTHLALGDTTTGAVVLGTAAVAVLVIWLGLLGLVAAAAEVEAIRRIAGSEEVVESTGGTSPDAGGGTSPWRLAGRVLIARVLAMLPLAVAIAAGGVRVVSVAYRELTVPSDTAAPLVSRVVGGAADALLLIVVTWFAAEVVGALAARRIVLQGTGTAAALGRSLVDALRHPVRTVIGALVPATLLLLVLVVMASASDATWIALRATLTSDVTGLMVLALVLLLAGLWLAGLVLIGVVSAWRGAVWTVQLARTFGGVATTRPGEWYSGPSSGTLGDLRPHGAEPDSR